MDLMQARSETLVVAAEEAGERLDRVLAARVAELSRSRHKALILAGRVAIDGATIRDPGHRVNAGGTIALDLPAAQDVEIKAENIPLTVVFEDDELIVIDKPAGLVVHPAAGNWSGTLVNALIAHCGDSLSGVGGEKRPGIVHRLDKNTSGLMVVAKTDRAHRSLSRQFADHGRTGPLRRGYLAFVWGVPDRPRGTIDKPIDRHPHARDKMAVREGGREALTHWEVLERYPTDGEPVASLLACRLETGRTHQIRVHLASIDIPCSATTSTVQASGPRPMNSGRTPRRRSRPLAGRPCMPIYLRSNIHQKARNWRSARNCRTISVVYAIASVHRAHRPDRE